jgi:hypothetical protein
MTSIKGVEATQASIERNKCAHTVLENHTDDDGNSTHLGVHGVLVLGLALRGGLRAATTGGQHRLRDRLLHHLSGHKQTER